MSSERVDILDPHGPADDPPGIVCWGEVLWDLFPDGRLLGGAPANVAYHLAQLGERVALASRVGDDELGREATDALAARGVDVTTVQVDPERPTGRVEVEFSRGANEPRYRLIPDCAWERIQVTPAVEHQLARARALCFGTLSQRTEIAAFSRAVALAPKGCLRVCDVNLRPKHVDLDVLGVALRAADVVKLNRDEADILSERTGMEDVPAWLFEEMGVGLIALTRGVRGSVFLRGTERVDHPGFSAEPGGDSVGAGDAFTAVLVHLLLRDRPLAHIATAANRYAAFVASRRGATPAVPRELIAGLAR